MKNYIKISIILFGIAASYTPTHARKYYIGLHAGYKAFYPEGQMAGVIDASAVLYLGDTLYIKKIYRIHPTLEINFRFHTLDIDLTKSPVGATPFHYDWDNNLDSLVFYVPNVTGKYLLYCDPHSNTMYQYLQVFPANHPTCAGNNIEGMPCLSFPGCRSCTGIVLNCQCTDPDNGIPKPTCTGFGSEDSSCTGIAGCNTCTGTVKNCSCVGIGSVPPPNNTTTGNGTFANYKTEIEPQIFPNPAEDQLQFTLDPSRKYRIEIYDIQGEMVINEGANRVIEHTLSIKSLKSGKYFAKVYYCACATPKVDCSKAIKTLKFIKK